MLIFFKNFFIKFKKQEREIADNLKKHFVWDKDLLTKLKKNGKTKFPNLKQLKYFPSLLTKGERKVFITFGAIFLVALFVLLLHLYFKLPLVPVRGGEYTEGIIGKVEMINPLFSLRSDAEQDVTKLVFSGLFKWKNNEITPDLVEKWETKNEGKNYILHLKKNVLWHDHKNFTADDVIFTIQTIQNEKVKSPLRETLSPVKIKKIDNETVEIVLEQPFPFFLSSLTFGIIPKHLWEKVSPESMLADDLNLSPVGTGPFRAKERIQPENGWIKKIVLERNKKYLPRPPHLNKITLKFFDNYQAAFDALTNKRIDGLSYARKSDDPGAVPKIYNSYKIPLSYYAAIFLNEESNVLSNKAMREALANAFDKREAIKNLKNIEPLRAAVINPEFRSEKIKDYDYSLAAAEKKLTSEGYKKKNGWFTDKKGWVLEINLVVSEGVVSEATGKTIQELWQKLGVKTNLKVLDRENFQKALQKNNYDVVLSTLAEGHDSNPFSVWHSSQRGNGLNLANFKNIKVNLLLEKAGSTTNKDERKKYYEEFQQIVHNDVPAIFLYQTKLNYFQNKKIKGFTADYLPYPFDRFADIENWYVFSRRGFKK